tara:strand:+ start:1611 stop:1814 length:204 start_codon:yes stop_codon:yes gene_type:complete
MKKDKKKEIEEMERALKILAKLDKKAPLKKWIDKVAEEEEEDVTCCNVKITDEIRDNDRCPVCMENL